MKNIINKSTFLAIIFASSLMGCKDYLDREMTSGVVTPDLIWQNRQGINGVLVNMYDGLRLDDFDDWFSDKSNLMNLTSLSDEAQGSYQKEPAFSNANAVYTYSDYVFQDPWSTTYVQIRRTNDFIIQVEKAAVLTEADKGGLRAEARFIRAMQYFGLVKRYGGVPLLIEPQEYIPGVTEALKMPRNTEAETYNFIINECKEIALLLPISRSGADKFRATKGAALALWSRAALYAGSIAKYSGNYSLSGEAVTRGYVNIPATEAEHFFTESYLASKELLAMTSVYSLYDKHADKAQNFYDLFSRPVNGNNGEYIYQKQYNVTGGKGHMWDKLNAPFSYRGDGWGCGMAPSLEMVEAFEYIDGTEGKLKLMEANGITPRRYTDPFELFAGKDPRLFGSVYLPGSPLKGSKIDWKRGIIAANGSRHLAYNQPNSDNTVDIGGVNYNASGKDGGADVGDASKSGFYLRKFFDETIADMSNIDARRSETPWVVFRLGEIYLNLAEAAMELNKSGEALIAINDIRKRAGIAQLASITLAKVRHERRVELAFEKHRYWDLKRWRIAHLDVTQGGLTNYRGTALHPWFNLSDSKYTFERGIQPKQSRMFLERNYYTRLAPTDISTNPLVVQNPGYGN